MFLDSDDALEKNACKEVALSFQEGIDLCIFQFKRQEGEIQYQENSWFNQDLSLNLDEFEKLWIDNGLFYFLKSVNTFGGFGIDLPCCFLGGRDDRRFL